MTLIRDARADDGTVASARAAIAAVGVTTTGVRVSWAGTSGADETTDFPSVWLELYSTRDGAYEEVATRWTDGANFHPQAFMAIESHRVIRADVVDGGRAIDLTWSNGDCRTFQARWLWERAHADDPVERIERMPWDGRAAFPEFDYGPVMDARDDLPLYRLLHAFFAYGIVIVHGVPRRSREILTVADRLSTLQKSHLGDIFTVKPTPAAVGSMHIGETSDEIPLHIDLVYKQRPPDVQMLHVLQQIERGGENVFVDAFHILSQIDPADVALLRDVPVWFVAQSETVHFRGMHPILAFDARRRFIGVHYNQYKIVFPVDTPPAYYGAFQRFRETIARRENTRAIVLPRDSIAIFHNRRTLHGRRAFESSERHYEGCFISEDDMKSRYRVLCDQLLRFR